MVRRFRMIAGPNGSGKSTLVARLRDEYAVNFYDFLNADDILSAVRRDGAYLPRFPVEQSELAAYAESSGYGDSVRRFFRQSEICVDGDCVRFLPQAVNSYTIALLTNFLQDAAIRRGLSFSQETVFSHPSKVEALPYLSRAYFFDNSVSEMTYLGQYAKESGILLEDAASKLPDWFRRLGIAGAHVG